jgi:hypothetical protein
MKKPIYAPAFQAGVENTPPTMSQSRPLHFLAACDRTC